MLKLQYFGHLMQRADSFERPWCWERLRAGGEGDDRGWDGWMASLTRWTWLWVDSRSWWWTGRPGVLRFMGSQRVGHDWATELNWIILLSCFLSSYSMNQKLHFNLSESILALYCLSVNKITLFLYILILSPQFWCYYSYTWWIYTCFKSNDTLL